MRDSAVESLPGRITIERLRHGRWKPVKRVRVAADRVYVTPVYTAGEEPIAGVDADALVAGLKSRGHRAAGTVTDKDDLARQLSTEIAPGDYVVCLGAGDITRWAAGLPEAISLEKAA